MASSTYNYIDAVNTNLICCICRAPFVNPVTTRTCAHTFCLDCIHTALGITAQCPVDRSPLTVLDLRAANPILRNLVDELNVECPHREDGCEFTCQRQLLGPHIRDDCAFALVPCWNPSCDKTVARRHLGRHDETCLVGSGSKRRCLDCGVRIPADEFEDHRKICVLEEVQCDACLVVVRRATLPAHTLCCPHILEACPHVQAGCTWIDVRHEQPVHLATCAFEHAVLRAENHALRARLDAMDGAIRALQDESRTARSALGPWFRSTMDSSVSSSTQPNLTVSGQNPVRGRRLSPLNAAMHRVASDAPYSPPASTDTPSSPTSVSPPPTLSPFAPAAATEEAAAFPYGFPPVTVQVPPIDTRGSLEGTLVGLRGSVASLATALDTLGKRHDVALMTETLRMHEDVQSLRAIVHGLRMQVHQVMMERTAQAAAAQATLSHSLSLYRTSSGASAGSDGDPHSQWSTRTEYVNEHPPPHAPPMVVAVRRTTENKL